MFHNQRGSHQRHRHADGLRVTATFHRAGETFPIGTLRSMIELQARWTEDDLSRLPLSDRFFPVSDDDTFTGRVKRYAQVGSAMAGLRARLAGERTDQC